MCIKIGDNELDTVRGLMSMSLNAIVSDVFDLDLDAIHRGLDLTRDLAMNPEQQQGLMDLVAEYFDGLRLNFKRIRTLDDLFQQVVDQEFFIQPA